LPQLKAGSTHLGNVLFTGLWFEMKEITEEVEVGFYSKEGLTKMNEDSNERRPHNGKASRT
jgi:hypothetical protein